MSTLTDVLCSADNRDSVVDGCVQMINSEVSNKGGLSGLAVKAAFKTVGAVKPGLVQEAVDHLLDRFVEAVEPMHQSWQQSDKSDSFGSFIQKDSSKVANLLLKVTDERISQSSHRTIKKAYEKLRPQAEKHVSAAVPALGRLVERYLS